MIFKPFALGNLGLNATRKRASRTVFAPTKCLDVSSLLSGAVWATFKAEELFLIRFDHLLAERPQSLIQKP